MTKSYYHKRRVKVANLDALQLEIARHLRGRLDVPWSLPTPLVVLIERLLAGPSSR